MKTRIIDRINNLKKWKKFLILLLYIIVIVRIEYIYIGNEGEQNYRNFEGYVFSDYTLLDCNNIIQEFKSDKNTLNGLELLFDNISDDKIGAINLCIYSDKELIYQTQLSLMNINNQEWKYVYVNAPMDDDKEYVLFMSATEECTQVPKVFVVKENYAPEIISSYNDTKLIDGQIAVNYGYLVSSESELKEHFKLTLCWLIYFIIALVIICNIEIIVSKYKKLKKLLLNRVKEQIVVAIIEIITCIVYVMFSGINFQVSTIIILLVTSILTTLHMDMKTSYVEKTVNTVGKRALLLASYAYSAFALVGQRIYVYPMNKYVSIKEILVYIAALVWFIPIVKSMLYYADVGRKWIFKEDKKRNVIVFATIIVLTLLVPAFINLIAFNPGISSIDTADSMLINAWNLEGMYDWHPFFYCLILRGLLEIWNSTYMVILVQYLFYAYVVTELMLYLRKKGVRDSFLIVVTAVIGFSAANYIQINTIWKDIPYTLSLLWTFIIVAKLSIDGDEYRKKWYIYLELVISLVGTDLYRKNGVVTFVIVFLCLIPLMKKNKKIIASLAACIVMIGIIRRKTRNVYWIRCRYIRCIL